ncbi:hypothetical protein D9M68_327360 [compost metagenome]
MPWEQGDSDAAVSGHQQSVEPEGRAQGFQYLAAGLHRVAGIHPWKQYRERGFGNTSDYFAGVHRLPQPCRNLLQQPVTFAVAQRLVDFTEVVDFDMQQGNRVVRVA